MSQTILAVGAHIGDMELTCGALLASCAANGGRAVTLALTAGEKGAPEVAVHKTGFEKQILWQLPDKGC